MTDTEILQQVREAIAQRLLSWDYLVSIEMARLLWYDKQTTEDQRQDYLIRVDKLLSLSVGDYTIQQLIKLAAKAQSNDGRLAVVRTKAEIVQPPEGAIILNRVMCPGCLQEVKEE